jgi:MFS family permease
LIGEKRGLHANFQIAAAVFIVSTIIIFFIRPQPVEKPLADSSSTGTQVFKNIRYLRFVILAFFIVFGLYLPQPLTPNFLQNERGIGLAVMGQLLAMRSIGIVIFNLSMGQLNARVGFLLSQVGMGIFVLLIWLSNSLPFYMLGYFMMGSYVTARGLIIAQSRALVESQNMGLAFGLLETLMSLAVVLGPPLAGYLYSINPEWIYLTSLALIIAGILANLTLSPLHRRDLVAFDEREKAQWTPS